MARIRVLRIVLVVLLVAGLAAAGVGLAQIDDPRWQSLATTRPESPLERLRRDERAPLLFVPDSVARDPSTPATLVLVLPGLGGTGRPMADQFTSAAERDRWVLLAPSPDYDPLSAGESLNTADLRVDDALLALIATAAARSPAPLAPLIDVVGFSRGAQQ